MKKIITIDGPAGSGKGRIAKYISKKFKLYHLDSGLIYRRVALELQKNNIEISNQKEIFNFLKKKKKIYIRNHNILRSEKISKITSKIAVFKVVRDFVNEYQRKIVKEKINKKGFVIDGRDIGSVVFKNAHIKLYIDVNIKIRAERRYKQLIDIGEKSIYPKILKDIKLRDKKDKSRKNSPLVVPKGAYIINNSGSFKSLIKQVNEIIGKIN